MAKRKAHTQENKTQPPTTTTDRRATRSTTTAAACRAVFDTAELLELILLQLPPSAIFRDQRVCRQFRDIVTSSFPIRPKLSLRTNKRSERWTMDRKGLDYFTRLPSGQEAAPKVKTKLVPARVNPYCLYPCIIDTNARPSFRFWHARGDHVEPCDNLKDIILRSFLDPTLKLSWHDMHITDAPTKAGHILMRWNIRGVVAGEYRSEFRVREGATIGDLVPCLRVSRQHRVIERGEVRRVAPALKPLNVVKTYEAKHGGAATWEVGLVCLDGVLLPDEEDMERVVNSDAHEI